MRHQAKFNANRSYRCGDMTFFHFFSRWRPSAVLDLFYVYLDHPRRAFVGLCHCAKFGWNHCSSFDYMPVLMLCEFGLKMPIHAPFWVIFLGIWPPRLGAISTNLTKVQSTDHSGSSGILLMLVSIAVPEKLPGQKVWRRRSSRRRRRRRRRRKNMTFLQ